MLPNLEELKKQRHSILEQKRNELVRQSLLSDEFIELVQKNKKPFDLLMCYYQCAIMEVETKFRVLDQEYSLEYDRNPIESIKTRIKSYEGIVKKNPEEKHSHDNGCYRAEYYGHCRCPGDLFVPGRHL